MPKVLEKPDDRTHRYRSVRIPIPLDEELLELADLETRNYSEMLLHLVKEALRTRQQRRYQNDVAARERDGYQNDVSEIGEAPRPW